MIKMMHSRYISFLVIAMIFGCASPKLVQAPAIQTEEVLLDSIQIVASRITPENKYELPTYRPSEKRVLDLMHTKLDLSFDWLQQAVNGKAWLTIKPLFHPQSVLELDALNFEIHAVTDPNTNASIPFDYDQKTLSIQLGQPITRFDPPITVLIDYTAHPSKGSSDRRGAVSSDKGLFFIDPLNSDPDVPMQIWTQGETENNHRWFPTIDHPNEKMTQEISMTVQDTFITLSNGVLVSSQPHEDGTRTDTWKLDQPHPPYLTMVAVGDFAVVRDKWREVPVSYYVEPAYAASAKTIFNHTPEMIEFFSQRLGYDFTWPKFDQIIVREFVSGAMENTTAVIYGDFIQDHADNFLVEDENEYIVAHELIHHWFGNLVTCESWANLTLNEGFANYGEYLWFEHKYGKDEADYSRVNELRGYFRESAFQMHPLIHYGYDDKDDMFDAHSYNKGGLVLHMLRSYLGDDVFFEGIKHYLHTHAFQTAEVHDLRIAFEDISGEDLNWFFDQWYLSPGHPVLEFREQFDPEKGSLSLQISQVQDPNAAPPVFRLPLSIDLFFADGTIKKEEIWMDRRIQQFEFRVSQNPVAILLNGNDALLMHVTNEMNTTENQSILAHSTALRHRLKALQSLVQLEEMSLEAYISAFSDPHWSVRSTAVDAYDGAFSGDLIQKVKEMAHRDPDIRVRLSALRQLADLKNPDAPNIAEKWLLESEKSDVVFTCLEVLVNADLKKAKLAIQKMNNQDNEALQAGKAMIFSADGDAEYALFFQSHLAIFNQYLDPFLENYISYFGKQNEAIMTSGLNALVDYVGSSKPPYQRYRVVQKLVDFLIVLQEGRLKTKINAQQKEDIYIRSLTALSEQVNKEVNVQWRDIMNRLLIDVSGE
jgi:aminopeptidase N